MRKSYLKYSEILILLLFVTWIISCSGKPGKASETVTGTNAGAEKVSVQKIIRISSPEESRSFTAGEIIKVGFEPEKPGIIPDSVVIYYDGKTVATLKKDPWTYNIETDIGGRVGRNSIKLIAYSGKNKPQVITRFITILSNIVPGKNHFKVINAYPHDKEAYTQGLIYEGGYLFEGTGRIGESDLRKVELKTGNVIKQQKIDSQLFGEGVAILDEKIFQLTWTSKVGFVYDKNTFKLINKVYYQTEGWGLAAFEDKLVMSDGTNMLYFIDPESFTVLSSIEVYDDKTMINNLNELEVINGEIWANIYLTDLIVRIDPNNGKVLAYVDLTGLLQESDRDSDTEVLNGIAWDSVQNRIFVTGKLWSKLFEIRLTE